MAKRADRNKKAHVLPRTGQRAGAQRGQNKSPEAMTTADKPVIVLAGLGLGITAYLTGVAWWGTAPALCDAGSGCDLIQQSRWSSVLGLPLALWGFVVYALIGFFAYRPMSRLRRWQRLWTLALLGMAISLYLTLVGIFALEATCGWCLASLAILTAIFVRVAVHRPPSAPGMAWWTWLMNSGVAVLVAIGGLHVYYNYADLLRPPQDPRLEELALHLEETGAEYYGAFWCTSCQKQSQLFGDAAEQLPYIECSPNGRAGPQAFACVRQNIQSYPTWIINGERVEGVLTPAELARRSGFDWETNGN